MCEIETKGDRWEVTASQEEIEKAMETIASGIRDQLGRKYERELKSGRMPEEAIKERVKGITEKMEEEIFHSTRKEKREDGQYILDVKDPLLVEYLIPTIRVPA